MVKKKNRPISDKELKFQYAIRKIDNRTSAIVNLGTSLIRYGALIVVFYIIYLCVRELAGKETMAKILISFFSEIKMDRWTAYVFGGGGVVYGLSQRKLRRKTISRISKRCDELEKKQNPNKNSSQISHDGKTNSEDKIWKP